MGLPVLRLSSSSTHAVTITPAEPQTAFRSHSPVTTAFPVASPGRLPHHPFRGLLSVHSHYGLRGRQVPYRTLYTRGFSRFVTSTTAPVATGRSESCRAGFAPAGKQRLCTAHAATGLPLDAAASGHRGEHGVHELRAMGVSGTLSRGIHPPRLPAGTGQLSFFRRRVTASLHTPQRAQSLRWPVAAARPFRAGAGYLRQNQAVASACIGRGSPKPGCSAAAAQTGSEHDARIIEPKPLGLAIVDDRRRPLR